MTLAGNRLDGLYAKLGDLKVSLDVLSSAPSISEADRLLLFKVLLADAEAITKEMTAIFNAAPITGQAGC